MLKDDLYAQLSNAESFNVGVQMETCSEFPKAPGYLAINVSFAAFNVPSCEVKLSLFLIVGVAPSVPPVCNEDVRAFFSRSTILSHLCSAQSQNRLR